MAAGQETKLRLQRASEGTRKAGEGDNQAAMEVEPPAAAALLVKCGIGGEPGCGTPRVEATAGMLNPPQETTTPASLRRGIAAAQARRKGGIATPSPSWKLEASLPRPPEAAGEDARGRRSSSVASARQLGATLWEIQDVIRIAGAGRRIRRRAHRDDDDDSPQSSAVCGGHVSTPLMKHDESHEDRCHAVQPISPASYITSIGSATVNLVSPTLSLNFRDRSREAGCNLKTSTELLKVLNRIWGLEEQHAVDVSAINRLKLELQHTHAHIQDLLQERQRYHYEIDCLVQQLTEDKLTRKNKEQEKIRTIHSILVELEDQRHLRKHSESLRRKLGKALSAMKLAFLKAVKDLEKEKKSTILLEDLCDEFALGIRNYEDEVRVLKKKHGKEYEQKFDKSVVHISEAWLDERMQIKNTDAWKDSEGKTSITDRLNSEIHSFIHTKRSSNNSFNIHIGDEKGDTSLCWQSLESVHLNGATSAPQLVKDDDDNSTASDLHCFELNMHRGAVQNHDLAGMRSVTNSIYSPMRRLGYSNGVAVEGSRNLNALHSTKDKVRSSISREQLNASTPEIGSHNGDKIAPLDEQDETVLTQASRQLHNDLLKIKSEPPRHVYVGRKSHDHSRTIEFRERATSGYVYSMHNPAWQLKNQHIHYQICECDVSENLPNLRSPSQPLKSQCAPLDYEISESSPIEPLGTEDNTLKTKLLQARLEGQHARIRASGYPRMK